MLIFRITLPYRLVSKKAVLRADHIAKDPDYIKFIEMNDFGSAKGALGWRKGARWATACAMTDNKENIEEHMKAVPCPILILHDPNDEITTDQQVLRIV